MNFRMKDIYFVLTYTGTWLSKRVRAYTKSEYSHISLSLDKELNSMYSFGRKNAYNPFFGGFIQEYTYKGTYKRFYNTKCVIYSYKIPDENYRLLKEKILKMYNERKKYKFNFLGLCAVVFNKKINRKYKLYCAEFVKYILQESKINVSLPEIVRPEDFQTIDGIKEIYKGYLRDYKVK